MPLKRFITSRAERGKTPSGAATGFSRLCRFIIKAMAFLPLCFFVCSCTNHDFNPAGNRANSVFTGNWQGDGVDSEGNGFTFYGKVNHLEGKKYRVLILDELDTVKKPIHVMDGVLEDNRFSYTSDEGRYEGGGVLGEDMFEGYYEGPVDGTFKMWRMKRTIGAPE